MNSAKFFAFSWLNNFNKSVTFLPTIRTNRDRTEISVPTGPIILGAVVVLLLFGWYSWQANNGRNPKVEREMLSTISTVIELPTEQPQIATVTDASQLNQAFFEKAKNGDYVIVYQQTGKVLLYRPSSKKVINFANIQIPTSETNTFITN